MANTVYNPNTSNLTDGSAPASDLAGKQGEKLVADLHGKYFNAAIRKNVFKFMQTAITLPVVASNLASKCTLWNPAGSGVIGEILMTEVGVVLATTVVNTIGWYFSSAAAMQQVVTTTASAAGTNHFSARTGETPANAIIAYTALTNVGTPVRVDMVAWFGATTAAVAVPTVFKNHEGTLLLMPGTAIHLAMSTAAGTASATDPAVTWAEWPYVS